MLFKQIYRNRKAGFLSLFFLLIPNLIFPMSPNSGGSSTSSNASSQSFSTSRSEFTERDIKKVWEGAPISVKNWAKELQCRNGKFRNLPYRLFLYGDPGVGKTTLAYGIQLQNKDWVIKRIAAGELINKHRGGAAQALNEKFDEIVREKTKTIILIDEAHMLMQCHEQEGYDTSETTEALKNFLDLHANDRDIMVILTGNDVSDMKESMRNRLIGSGVRIPLPTTEQLHEIFRHHAYEFSCDNIQESDLIAMYKAAQIKSGRDIQTFMNILRNTVVDSGYEGSLKDYQLSRDLFLRVAPLFVKNARDFGAGTKRLTQREFQQKLHDDGIRENRRQHEATERANDRRYENSKWEGRKIAGAGLIGAIGGGYLGAKLGAGNSTNSTTESEESTQTSAQSSTQQSGESNAVKVVGVAATVAGAVTAGVASTGGSVAATTAATGMGAKAIVIGKAAIALACAHPFVAAGGVIGSLLLYCCCKNSNNDHEHEE